MNNQPSESAFKHPQGALQVQEVFPTIQGEGPLAGTPAVFVRLAGCNLQCPACDTDYTSRKETNSPSELVSRVRHAGKLPSNLVVITGGEPFRQNLTPFTTLLLGLGYRVQIETNGTNFLDGFPFDRVMIVCSPKTGRINYDLARNTHAFKYVVQSGYISETDGLPTMTLGQIGQHNVARPPAGSTAEIFVSPLDEKNPSSNYLNTKEAIAICQRYGYRLCLQLHKFVNLP